MYQEQLLPSRFKEDLAAMQTSPVRFFKQVKQEFAKVVWPTRRETVTAVGMVFVMVSVMAVFFLGVDQVIAWAVSRVLG